MADDKTPAQTLKALERKASQTAMIKAAEAAIVRLCKARADEIAALTDIVAIAEAQKTDAEAAQAYAEEQGLPCMARELGRGPVMAATIYALADVALPPRDATGAFVRPQAWMQQFAGDGAASARAQAIQKILNNGEILTVEGLTDEQVARELLAGRNPTAIAPKPVPAEVREDAPGWYGFKGNQTPSVHLPDSNLNVS